MNIEGIILVVICLFGYWYAWRTFSQNKFTLSIVLLLVLGLIIRLYVGSDFFLHPWDERYHALVAKNMIDNPLIPTLYKNPILPFNVSDWTTNHVWLHKQPLPLWTMSLSMSVFGVNELALRLPSLLLSVFGIYLMYEVGKMLFNKKVGFISAFLFSIHGLIIEMVGGRVPTDHIDAFFLIFILLAVYFSLYFAKTGNWIYNLLVGIAIGLAILSKWLPALIVIPIWYLIIARNKKFNLKTICFQGLIIITAILCIALPWQIYIHSSFPIESAIEEAHNLKHLTETLDGQGGSFLFHFDKMRMVYGELIYIPLVWLVYLLLKKRKNKLIQILAIWILIPFVFFSAIQTKMQGYTLFTAPAIFLLSAFYWVYLKRNLNNFRFKKLTIILLFGLIILPIRYSFERVKPFQKFDRNPKWISEIKKVKTNNTEKSIIVNAKNSIEIMFYTGITSYDYLPPESILDSLLKDDYEIMTNDYGLPYNSQYDSLKFNYITLATPD